MKRVHFQATCLRLWDMIDHLPRVPFGKCYKLSKIAGRGVWNDLGHAVHVFVRSRLHQAAGILASIVGHVMMAGLETFVAGIHERRKAPPVKGGRVA